MQKFAATVVRLRDLTHDVRELELRLDAPSSVFDAGQFVSFQVPVSHLRSLTRPYSIASPSSVRSSVTASLQFRAGGPGSTFLYGCSRAMRCSSATAGTFTLRDMPDRDLLLVATATGIAPLRSILLASGTAGQGSDTALWGLRSERDLSYQEELRALAKAHQRFSFVTTLSQPSNQWSGERGRVQQVVEQQVQSVEGLLGVLLRQQRHDQGVTDIIRRKGLCPIHREQDRRDRGLAVKSTEGSTLAQHRMNEQCYKLRRCLDPGRRAIAGDSSSSGSGRAASRKQAASRRR